MSPVLCLSTGALGAAADNAALGVPGRPHRRPARPAGVWLLNTPSRSTLPLPGPPCPVAMAHLEFGPTGPYLAAPLEVSGPG